jgi:hypothetical protein
MWFSPKWQLIQCPFTQFQNATLTSRPRQEIWLLPICFLTDRATRTGEPEDLTGPGVPESRSGYVSPGGCNPSRSLIRRIPTLLRVDQKPDLAAAQIEILDSRKWYALDWSNLIHQALATSDTARQPLRRKKQVAGLWGRLDG